MIQFKYKNFSENAVKGSPGVGSSLLSSGLGLGMAGVMGAGMVQSHKQAKAAEEEGGKAIAAMEQQTRAINKHLDNIEERGFALPAALAGLSSAAGIASTGVMGAGMVQSHFQGKKQEEMNEAQVAAQDRQTQALQRQNALLKRIEEKGTGSPEKVASVVDRNFSSILSERRYGFNMSGVTTAMRDIWRSGKSAGVGKGLKSNFGFGLATAGTAYGVNKIISHDIKKSGLDVDETGNLIQKQKAYADPIPQQAGVQTGKKATKSIFSKLKSKAGMPLMMGAIEAPRAMNYFAEKRAFKDQIAGTQEMQPEQPQPQQRAYAFNMSSLAKGWNTFKSHKMRTITGGLLNFGSFGVFNTKKVQTMAGKLAKKGNTEFSRNLGKWAQNHQTLANTALLAPGIGMGTGAFALGEKAIKKPMKAIDPNAYKYQEAKDKAAQQQPQPEPVQPMTDMNYNYGQV